MLFISDIALTVLKMVCMQQTVCLQRHTKFSDTLQPMERKCLKNILTYEDCTKYDEIDIYHLHIQKQVSYKKFCKKYKSYVYRLTQKFSDTLHPTGKNI